MYHPAVDQYIEKSQLFAQPILRQLREMVHHICPQVEEKIKWQFPCFEYKGKILCSMAAFKAHCAFGFWQAALLSDPYELFEKGKEKKAMGDLGRLSDLSHLPSLEILQSYFIEAMLLIDNGVKMDRPTTDKVVSSTKAPDYLLAALGQNSKAQATWDAFPASCRNEYIEWISEAKRESTRASRIATMLEWLQEGKSRHWKYK
jgi:uncharacterized protein YdeI (YjbR/CyaY-like superfamily)